MHMSSTSPLRRLALVVGGGPAPGINGVISAVTIQAINHGIDVYGIRNGFRDLVNGDVSHVARLSIEDVKGVYLRGGSMLGTSRTNPTKSAEHMQNVLNVLKRLEIDALVTVGGDDTAFS